MFEGRLDMLFLIFLNFMLQISELLVTIELIGSTEKIVVYFFNVMAFLAVETLSH